MAVTRFVAAAASPLLLLLLLCLSCAPQLAAAARAPRDLRKRPAPAAIAPSSSPLGGSPLPVVLWHGMGDWCCDSRSMGHVEDMISTGLGTYVYSVRLGESEAKDRDAGFLGDVNAQIAQVCDTLAEDPKLAGGFNAVGFSQGAQFLRAVVEMCPTLRNGSATAFPRVHKLVSFGGQHQGVMEVSRPLPPTPHTLPSLASPQHRPPDLSLTLSRSLPSIHLPLARLASPGPTQWPGCGENVSGFFCNTLRALMAMGAYSDLVRTRLVQAQYFKDPFNYPEYLARNVFLPHINNEIAGARRADYAKNLASLDLLLL